ncbi:MAG: MFS transporter [Candidatus Heimdallarchaeota archaeon]
MEALEGGKLLYKLDERGECELKKRFGISINIILLGVVSFLTDISSEIILPILPFFIVALGGAGLAVGLVGGLEGSISSILKVFSGYFSDKLGKRKALVAAGYFTSSVSKLVLPFSTTVSHVFFLRSSDRVGKGVRTAPRDALIADYSAQERRGRAFGFHRAMDSAGAIIGSVLALLLFWFLELDFNKIILIGAVLAFSALIPLVLVREPRKTQKLVSLEIGLKRLPRSLRLFIIVASVFALGNFTYMFFILRAQSLFEGRGGIYISIALYVWFNIIYTAFSVPAGVLSDKFGRRGVLAFGYFLFGVTCLGFIVSNSMTWLTLFFAVYGVTNAIVEGTQRAFAADLAPVDLRGTGLGTFHTAVGLAALPGGIIAGLLWSSVSPEMMFLYGAILGFFAAGFLVSVK